MELLVRGLRRNHGTMTLVLHDLSKMAEPFAGDDVEFSPIPDGVMVSADTKDLKLNGDYLVRLKLSKDDILWLAKVALRNEAFGKVADAMAA